MKQIEENEAIRLEHCTDSCRCCCYKEQEKSKWIVTSDYIGSSACCTLLNFNMDLGVKKKGLKWE